MIPSRSRGRTALAVGSLLILGALAGVTGDRLLHRRPAGHGGLSPAEIHADPMAVIDRELDLRLDQRQRIVAILAARQGQIDRVWLETRMTLRTTIDSVVTEIIAVLDAEQAARFRALFDQLHPEG